MHSGTQQALHTRRWMATAPQGRPVKRQRAALTVSAMLDTRWGCWAAAAIAIRQTRQLGGCAAARRRHALAPALSLPASPCSPLCLHPPLPARSDFDRIDAELRAYDEKRETVIKRVRGAGSGSGVRVPLPARFAGGPMQPPGPAWRLHCCPQSRDIQKAAKQAIFSLHRGAAQEAEQRLAACLKGAEELAPLVKAEPMLRPGSYSNAIEEYAEALAVSGCSLVQLCMAVVSPACPRPVCPLLSLPCCRAVSLLPAGGPPDQAGGGGAGPSGGV